MKKGFIFAHVIERHNAKIAQLVEHDLAKVGVAGSSPVFRSKRMKREALEKGNLVFLS